MTTPQDDPEVNVRRFIQLFRVNQRSYGTWTPKNAARTDGKGHTVRGNQVPYEAFRSHLEGNIGLGGVPILDDGTVWWACIDYDPQHGPRGKAADLVELAGKIEKFKYPLIVCRSKTGGAHLYVFFAEPTSAAAVCPLLGRWAAVLGFPEAEIFPKQTNLDTPLGDSDRPLGNWINLPYFSVKDTNRYCISGGKQVSFEYFLELAEGKRYRIQNDATANSDEYLKGPPCLQEMIKNRLDEGSRNNAVFQASVFLKRAFNDDWKIRVAEFNGLALNKPLNSRELRTITASVQRKDYNYKCREEPCRSFCNRELCRTREFGITDADTKANELPPFDRVEKVIATPIRWVLHIKGLQIELDTAALFDFGRVRQAVYEKLNLLLPRMKNEEWDVHLREIAGRADMRMETTLDDVIFQKLCAFLRRASQDRLTPEEERREVLTRGMPALISITDTKYRARGQFDDKGNMEVIGRRWYYAFQAQSFIDHMRRHKALIVQEHQVHTILHRILDAAAISDKEEGTMLRDRFRIGNRVLRNIWLVPEESIATETVPVRKFAPEF